MGQGRGSATAVATVALALLCLLVTTEAAEYKVGDYSGWTFNVAHWTHGKRFRAGDVLVFKYPPGQHNVVRVKKLTHDTCFASPFAKAFTSGMDRVNLVKGPNYFICGFPGHCQMGMKIAINAM